MAERVTVVGGGVVGTATARALDGAGHRVRIIETSPGRRAELARLGLLVEPAPDATIAGSIVLLCVETPADEGGFDLGALRLAAEQVGRALEGAGSGTIVVVRSTVPVGTTTGLVAAALEQASGRRCGQGFVVASAPEFLRAATATQDASAPWMTVLGCADRGALDRLAATLGGFGGDLRLFADPAVAEAIKLVHHALNATKISFFNEAFAICAAAGVDGDAVAEVVVRSAEAATNPEYGTKGGRAFGGACLPKDLDGMIAMASQGRVPTPLLEAVRAVNRGLAPG